MSREEFTLETDVNCFGKKSSTVWGMRLTLHTVPGCYIVVRHALMMLMFYVQVRLWTDRCSLHVSQVFFVAAHYSELLHISMVLGVLGLLHSLLHFTEGLHLTHPF